MSRTRLVALLALTVLPGCLATTVQDARAAPGSSHRLWTSFYLLGAVGQADFDARDLCPAGVASVESYTDPLTLGLSLITLGIYTPRKLEVVCAAPPAGAPP